MAEIVTMPKLGFDMAEGTLVRWVKAEHDPVEKGQVIAEIETDKATVEVESTFSGVMARHLVEEGTSVPVNAPIAVIVEEGEKLSDAVLAELVGKEDKAKKKPDADTTKTKSKAEKPSKAVEIIEPEEENAEMMPAGGVRSSPLARRMAEDQEIDLSEVEGSGPQGRIVKKDVEAFLKSMKGEGRNEEADVVRKTMVPLTNFAVDNLPEDDVVEMSRLRQAIGRRMQDSNQNFPHFYITRVYDSGPMMDLRKKINQLLPDEEKLSVNDFLIKGVALALRQFPNLNASIEDEKHIRRHGQVNVGVAVAVEGGLLTVVCTNADQKPLRLIAREVREMVGRAREGKVRNEDIQGSTFSISNLGMFGVDEFSAIINPPEAGILAVSAVQNVPVVEDEALKIGSRMKATLSADHRVTDGAEGAEFMRALADYIESPLRLII
jgi:pyruvate dehydrogenase E2 component (dihydrolipoamide acetyltransferase)